MKVRCVTGVARELVKSDEMWFGVHSNGTRQDACTLNYSRYSRSFSPSLPRTIRCFGILFKQSSERSWHRDCLDRLENCLRVKEKQVNEENGWKMKSAGKEVRKFLLHQAFVCYYFSLFFCTSIGSRVVQGLMGWKNNDNPISKWARERQGSEFHLHFFFAKRREGIRNGKMWLCLDFLFFLQVLSFRGSDDIFYTFAWKQREKGKLRHWGFGCEGFMFSSVHTINHIQAMKNSEQNVYFCSAILQSKRDLSRAKWVKTNSFRI